MPDAHNDEVDEIQLPQPAMADILPALKDVTIIFCLDIALSVPFVAVRLLCRPENAEIATAYMAIVGVVLSGWGIFATLKAAAALRLPWVTFFYSICLVELLMFYGSAGLALVRGARF
jgi:hypothetical protein